MLVASDFHLFRAMTTIPNNIPFTISTSDSVRKVHEAEEIVIGQLGQTLDGCIATLSGDSKYINSQCGLKHLHALRSAVDAVVVGVNSVNADDPNLTVRLCDGENPVRVIIDPNARVCIDAGLFRDNDAECCIITCNGQDHPASDRAEIIELPSENGHISPAAIISVLKAKGWQRILIEGGNCTLSRFIDAGMLDRLHLIVAPIIMGAGLPGLNLSPIDKLGEAMRPEVTVYPLGHDIVFDCNLRSDSAS